MKALICIIAIILIVSSNVISKSDNENDIDTLPRLGALVANEGHIQFIKAVLLIKFEANVEDYVEDQLLEIFEHTANLITLMRHGGLVMSYAQRASIESLLKSLSYTYGEILPYVSDTFLPDRMNFTNADQMEENWRALVWSAIQGIRIGASASHVVPTIEKEIADKIKSNITTRTVSRPMHRPVNDQEIPVHPKLRGRRALIDVGGNLLHSLFGVTTDDQLAQSEANLQSEVESVLAKTRTVEAQSKLAQRKLADAMKHVQLATDTLLSVSSRENRLEAYVQISQVLEHMEAIIFHLHDIAVSSATHRTLLSRGIVPQIFDAEQLRSLIKEGEKIFSTLKFPLDVNKLSNKNIAIYLNILKSEPTRNTDVFAIFLPFTDNKFYELFAIESFPFFANANGTKEERKILIPDELPNYVAITDNEFVNIEDIQNCARTKNASVLLCAQKNPSQIKGINSCATAIIKNDTKAAFQQCNYKEIKLKNNYYAKHLHSDWYVIVDQAEVATIHCPDRYKLNSRQLKSYTGTLKIKPPCEFSTPRFTLPTIQTKTQELSNHPVKILPVSDVIFNSSSNMTFSTKDIKAIENDLEVLENITQTQHEHIKIIKSHIDDNTFDILHGTSGILIVVLIVCIIGTIIVCRRRPDLMHQLLPFFLLQNTSSLSRTRTRNIPQTGRSQSPGSDRVQQAAMSLQQTATQGRDGQFRPPRSPSPVNEDEVELNTMGGEEGTAEYTAVNRDPPGTSTASAAPIKPSRYRPPVRFTGHRVDLYSTRDETPQEDSQGYLIPRGPADDYEN